VSVPKFNGLDEVTAMLGKLAQAGDDNQAAAGMTTVTLLAAAMMKIIDEIEQLKQTRPA
jgi:hypothetical protein